MNITWNASEYEDKFHFVHQYGEDVLGLVTAKPGSRVVDLGCGNGALTAKLAERGYRVIGLDASPDMVAMARERHPDLDFGMADAVTFQLEEKTDVIFSNAVLHWIDADKQPAMLKNLAAQLNPGGELVCELGGKGCAETVHRALEARFAARGLVYPRVFYFPSIGEYAPLLEQAGFRVETAVLFDRPTKQASEDGLADWIRMFLKAPFAGMAGEEKEAIIRETVEDLRPVLYRNGSWIVDYVRLRFRARIPERYGFGK